MRVHTFTVKTTTSMQTQIKACLAPTCVSKTYHKADTAITSRLLHSLFVQVPSPTLWWISGGWCGRRDPLQ